MADNPRIEELRRRVLADPASIAFAALAEEFRRAGRHEEAVATCRAGLQRHPAYLSARVTLGRALIETADYDGAREELETVLRSAPENLAAIRGLAQINERLGHSTEMDPHLADLMSTHAESIRVSVLSPEPEPEPEPEPAPAAPAPGSPRSFVPVSDAAFTMEPETVRLVAPVPEPAPAISMAPQAPSSLEPERHTEPEPQATEASPGTAEALTDLFAGFAPASTRQASPDFSFDLAPVTIESALAVPVQEPAAFGIAPVVVKPLDRIDEAFDAAPPAPAAQSESETVFVEPEAAVLVEFDTVLVEPETVLVESETVLVEPEAVLVESDTVLVEHETVLVESETVLIEPEAVLVESETVLVEPEAVLVESETVLIEPEMVMEAAPEPEPASESDPARELDLALQTEPERFVEIPVGIVEIFEEAPMAPAPQVAPPPHVASAPQIAPDSPVEPQPQSEPEPELELDLEPARELEVAAPIQPESDLQVLATLARLERMLEAIHSLRA
jgi:hypothetical protein